MPREKECYRDNLQRLDERFPGKETLSMTEAASYIGISKTTMWRNAERYCVDPVTKRVSKVQLARALS